MRARHTADNDYAPVLLVLRRGVWIFPLWCRLRHCGRGVFEGEEGRHAVRLEAFLEIGRASLGDGGRPEDA